MTMLMQVNPARIRNWNCGLSMDVFFLCCGAGVRLWLNQRPAAPWFMIPTPCPLSVDAGGNAVALFTEFQGFFCTGEPNARFFSACSASVRTASSLLACLVKLFTRDIKERTRARKTKNPKLSSKFRSTTYIR